MPKFKIINLTNLSFFGAALLATSATHCFNPSKLEAVSSPLVSSQPLHSTPIKTVDKDLVLSQNNLPASASSPSSAQSEASLLLAQGTDSVDKDADNPQSRSRLIRLVTLSFFLLFFVPLGIFYPLFLFYKMLLIKPESSRGIPPSNYSEPKVAKSSNLVNSGSQAIDTNKATVSKLQIAFSPPARELRKELSRVSSIIDADPNYDLLELMQKTVRVLIEQGHWTHASHSEITLPLKQIRAEFDSICDLEGNKFTSKHPGLIDYNRNVSSSEGYERNYSYVVATLVFCTSQPLPLFQTISTKDKLVEDLVKLEEMPEDSLIKFESIWNPQQEDIYISNEQLLIEYEDLARLF